MLPECVGKKTRRYQFKENDRFQWNDKPSSGAMPLVTDWKKLGCCPEGVDFNEWLAYNVIDFFNQTNMLYEAISDYCTSTSCPVMSAGRKYEYHWADGIEIKKAIKVPAPQYVEFLMAWIQNQLDDEKIFPPQAGAPYPQNFTAIVKYIIKRMFRVFAHIYCDHYTHIEQIKAEAVLNTYFKHFVHFFTAHNFVPKKEMAPLAELIRVMKDS